MTEMHFLQLWRLEIQDQSASMIGLRALFQVTDVMLYSHMAEGYGELCEICFKSAGPIHERFSFMTKGDPHSCTY